MGDALTGISTQRPASSWPLMTHLELAALPTAASCARMHAKAVVLEWGLPTLVENIELIVSELVTNSIRAVERPRRGDLAVAVVRLWLFSDLRRVLISVWDGNTRMPVRQDAGPDEVSGRGLMLVEHLSSDWGTYRKADGKVVWALLLCIFLQSWAGWLWTLRTLTGSSARKSASGEHGPNPAKLPWRASLVS
jgi:anti-sigma regulatory factor (Ser/Thr protein kinase)